MPIDVARALKLTTREVADRDHGGTPARAVIARRTYDTTVDDLWDALTNPERIPRWFLPVTGDLRLGGRYQIEGHAGGTITACEPPHHFAATWEFGGGTSWIRVRLEDDPAGGARLELEHTVPVDDHWDQFGPGATGVGWDLLLTAGLDQHLATRAAVEPAAALEWTVSSEGRAFIRGSSDEWGRAAIASGVAAAAALAAAARTMAFYTGQEPG